MTVTLWFGNPKVKNAFSYTSFSYVVIAWCCIEPGDNFTFILFFCSVDPWLDSGDPHNRRKYVKSRRISGVNCPVLAT